LFGCGEKVIERTTLLEQHPGHGPEARCEHQGRSAGTEKLSEPISDRPLHRDDEKADQQQDQEVQTGPGNLNEDG